MIESHDSRRMPRREFIGLAAAAGSAITGLQRTGWSAAKPADPRFAIGGFIKPIQDLPFERVSDIAAQAGWAGIESPVRPGGQILPERAADDLPRLVEALAKKGLQVLVMATAIQSPDDPHAESLLRTASRLGIRRYRLNWWKYDDGIPIIRRLEQIKPQLRDLAALNKELGLCGVLQNHSGGSYVGGPIWDLYELLREHDPRHLAVQFDIGHAAVEGGTSWPVQFRLVQDRLGMVSVKDFTWQFTAGKGGKTAWCPLGRGMVGKRFFEMLRKSDYRGPVSLHFEYRQEGRNEEERVQNLVRAMQQDTRTLESLLGT